MKLKRHTQFINELKSDPIEEIINMVDNELQQAGFEIVNVFDAGFEEGYLENTIDSIIGYQKSSKDTFLELLFTEDPGYENLKNVTSQLIPNSILYEKESDGYDHPVDYVLAFNLKNLLKSDFIKSKRGIIKYNL